MQPYDFTDRDMHTTILVAKVQKNLLQPICK